jgi:hypothetical protein
MKFDINYSYRVAHECARGPERMIYLRSALNAAAMLKMVRAWPPTEDNLWHRGYYDRILSKNLELYKLHKAA